ncbi:hypothetical protein MDAP_001536 [Mitosporidium daphniae]
MATASSSAFSLKSTDNPNVQIQISPTSDSHNLPSSKSEIALEAIPSETSMLFFQNSDQQGSFEPVRLSEISNVLSSGETFKKHGAALSSSLKPASEKRSILNSQFLIEFLNGLIGISLMIFTNFMLNRIGDSYSYPFFEYQANDTLFPLLELIRWCGFILWIVGSYLFTLALLDLIPHMLIEFTSFSENDKFCEELAHMIRLRPLIISFIVCLFSVFMSNRIFLEATTQVTSISEDITTQLQKLVTWQFLLRRTIIAITCITGAFTLEQWLMQRVSISFHRFNYRDRIKENNFKMAVIMTLKKFALAQSKVPFSQALSGLFAHIAGITPNFSSFEGVNSSAKISSFENYDLDQYHSEATTLAYQIFVSLKRSIKKDKDQHDQSISSNTEDDNYAQEEEEEQEQYEEGDAFDPNKQASLFLVQEDFNFIFPNSNDASEAFKLLDQNDNGDISVQELSEHIISTFKERGTILKSLAENESIIRQLDILALSLLGIVLFALVLQIFDLSTSCIAAFGTVFFGLSFVFAKLASNLLYSVVFVLLSHPYDVGDRVSFDEYEGIIVTEIGLLSTVFITNDGRCLYIQNSILFDKPIYNIRRSLPQTETISFKFGMQSPQDLMDNLYTLKEALINFFEILFESRYCGGPSLEFPRYGAKAESIGETKRVFAEATESIRSNG